MKYHATYIRVVFFITCTVLSIVPPGTVCDESRATSMFSSRFRPISFLCTKYSVNTMRVWCSNLHVSYSYSLLFPKYQYVFDILRSTKCLGDVASFLSLFFFCFFPSRLFRSQAVHQHQVQSTRVQPTLLSKIKSMGRWSMVLLYAHPGVLV